MTSHNNLDDRLGALLRAGDPAADESELSDKESAHLRRLVLGSVRSTRPTRWLPITAALAAALLAAVLLLPDQNSPLPTSSGAPPTAVQTGTTEASRQIHFSTEQGTQIIWVLDSNLDLWNKEL